MDKAEYQRERQRLQETYGDPDGSTEGLAAKRDQAFAELFYRSGWTQQQLAEAEGRTQQWEQTDKGADMLTGELVGK